MAKTIFSKNNTANSSPRDITISPMANIEDYIGTDRFGIYVHGTKGGYNDLPTEGCYHGDAWIVNQHIIMWSATEEQWVDLGIIAGVQGPEGPEGPQGVEGPEGKEGPMGPQGNDGFEGPAGPIGERGPQGPAGLGLYIMGTIESESDLSGKCTSRPGQTWFLNGDAWVWDGEAFNNIGKIQGPEGPEGKQGEKGDQGESGERGEPGREGAKGEQGPRGPQGIKGDQGEKGDQGDSVTLAIREVRRSEPGSMPEVNISNLEGKPPIQYVDFTLPQGEKGPVGPIGPPNYIEVAGVTTIPSDQPARVEITSELSYGLKLLDSNNNEWLLDVDLYGKIFTEPITAQNNVPGGAVSYIEIFSDEIIFEGIPTGENNLWYLYVNEDGKIILDDGEEELIPPPPEPEEPEEQPLRVFNDLLIRTVNKKNPLILTAPNKSAWRVGVTYDTDQLYTINADNEIITSESYIHQKASFFIPQGIKGEKGDKGDRGPQGAINLIEAGEIISLEPHEKPQFDIEQINYEFSETEPDILAKVTQRLNLKIPRGEVGEKGETGRANRIIIKDVFTLPNEQLAEVELSEAILDRDPRFTIQEMIMKLPRGEKGDQGWSIDHKWEGTVLFIKREDSVDWGEGVDLKGEKGDSQTFEGGIIKGDTTFDGRMDFVNSMYFDHEKLIGLTNFNDDIAFGFKNLIAKNSLQIGYQRNDDYECINPHYHPDGELCDTDPPEPNKYDKYPAVINLHTMNGESYITKQLDNTLEFSGDGNINFITPDVQHNGLTLANKPYVDAEIESLKDYVGDFVGGMDGNIREYVDQQDNIVRNDMSSLISSSITSLDNSIRIFVSSEDTKILSSSKTYTDTKDASVRTYLLQQDNLVKSFAQSEDDKVKTFVSLEDQKYYNLSKQYTDERLQDLDITGSFVEYIMAEDEKYLQISKDYTDEKFGSIDILGSVTDYIEQENQRYFQLSKDYTDDAETRMTSHTNISVSNAIFETKSYADQRDTYFEGIFNGKILSTNNKIDNVELKLETKIEENNLFFYNEILEVNKTVSQNYVSLSNNIKETEISAKNYTDSEILLLDIPTFKLDVANMFDTVSERNTIDEQNLYDTNLFMIENFAAVNQMIEDLDNKIYDYLNIKDENGIEWALGIDTSGRIKTMKKSVAIKSGFVKQKESTIVEKLFNQILALEERIKQLEK